MAPENRKKIYGRKKLDNRSCVLYNLNTKMPCGAFAAEAGIGMSVL